MWWTLCFLSIVSLDEVNGDDDKFNLYELCVWSDVQLLNLSH